MQMLPTQPGEPFGWFTGWGRAGPERRQTGSGPGSSMHMYLYDINYKGWENLELAAPVSGTPKNALNMFNNKQQQNKTKKKIQIDFLLFLWVWELDLELSLR